MQKAVIRMSSRTMNRLSPVNLNNAAIAMLEANNYSKAIRALFLALEKYRSKMSSQRAAAQCTVTGNTSLDECMFESSCCDRGDSDRGRYVYRQAIRLPQDYGQNYLQSTMASAIIIFNLGLAYQLFAERQDRDKPNRRVALEKAVKLYQLALGMQKEEDFDCNTMFVLAITNNLGVIHLELNDHKLSIKYFERLMSILLYLSDRGEEDASRYLSNSAGFLRNASSILQKNCAAPAA